MASQTARTRLLVLSGLVLAAAILVVGIAAITKPGDRQNGPLRTNSTTNVEFGLRADETASWGVDLPDNPTDSDITIVSAELVDPVGLSILGVTMNGPKGQAWRWLAMPIALLAIVALGTGQLSHDGRRESGGAGDGMVLLINASSPANDIYNAQFCGGVVVELRLVLTAAHCVAMRSAASIDVVIGGDNLCRDRPIDGLRIRVSRVRIHPAYDAESARFDLAVLALAVDAPPDAVRDVAISPADGGPAVALGWGRGSPGGVPPCRLLRAELRLLPQPECAEQAGASDRAFDPASMLCAIPDQIPSQDTCSGDSGGPLVLGTDPRRGEVVGITSWGRGCGDQIPGVYARAEFWRFTA